MLMMLSLPLNILQPASTPAQAPRGVWLAVLAAAAIALVASPAQASWTSVERFLAPGVEVTLRTDEQMRLRHRESGTEILLTQTEKPSQNQAKTSAGNSAIDFYSRMERRLGGNPYRVWHATEHFVKRLPKNLWGRLFRVPFLRSLRLPKVAQATENQAQRTQRLSRATGETQP